MYVLLRSREFDAWLLALSDVIGKARILARLRSAEFGNFGDCKPVGEGVSEMRVNVGPGYRLCDTRKGRTVFLLLTGGDESTQSRDITRAKALAHTLGKGKP